MRDTGGFGPHEWNGRLYGRRRGSIRAVHAESVADAVSRALQNRTTLRQQARHAALAAFDAGKIADELIGLLHRATSQKSLSDLVSSDPLEGPTTSAEKEPTTLNA